MEIKFYNTQNKYPFHISINCDIWQQIDFRLIIRHHGQAFDQHHQVREVHEPDGPGDLNYFIEQEEILVISLLLFYLLSYRLSKYWFIFFFVQARKEARKRELKKNKKQRQLVRAAVLKGKNPRELIVELEKIDDMEFNPLAPPPLNEKVKRLWLNQFARLWVAL